MAARTGARNRKGSSSKRKALEPIESWRQDASVVETLAQDVTRALATDDLPLARRSFTEYREQVLAHLGREEDVTFPAAEERAPAQGGPIRSLRVAHIGIRSDLERVASHLALGHIVAARAVFAAFLETFRSHERLEDQLIGLLSESA
ncbi:MAG: hemerythrin domain-containing protein [bacterium]